MGEDGREERGLADLEGEPGAIDVVVEEPDRCDRQILRHREDERLHPLLPGWASLPVHWVFPLIPGSASGRRSQERRLSSSKTAPRWPQKLSNGSSVSLR